MFSEAACAEWVRVVGDASSGMTTYADPSSVRKEIGLVRISSLDDFTAPHDMAGKHYSSRQADLYIDCKGAKERLIDLTLYTDRMGKGKVVLSANGPVTWSLASARNVGPAIMHYACDGKVR